MNQTIKGDIFLIPVQNSAGTSILLSPPRNFPTSPYQYATIVNKTR